MRFGFALLVFSGLLAAAEPLPILGLAHVGFQVSDIEKARQFYHGTLGYEPVFSRDKPDGSGIATICFKINDEQYLEVSPGLTPDRDQRMTHLSVYTADIEKLHQMLAERDLKPTEIVT